MNQTSDAKPRGRPRGSVKPIEEKRRRISMTLSPKTHELLQDATERLHSSNKTDFVEKAIWHYYQHLFREDPSSMPKDAEAFRPDEDRFDGLMSRLHRYLDENTPGDPDFVDRIVERWNNVSSSLGKPKQPKSFEIYARATRLAYHWNQLDDIKVQPYGIKRI